MNTSNGAARSLDNKPIVTGGVEIRRLPCLFLSRSNGGARKGAVSKGHVPLAYRRALSAPGGRLAHFGERAGPFTNTCAA